MKPSTQLRRLTPRHFEILRLALLDKTNDEIAKEVGLHPVRVSQIRNSDLFKKELEKWQKDITQRTADIITSMKRRLAEIAPSAVDTIEDILTQDVREVDMGDGDTVKIPIAINLKADTAWKVLKTLGVEQKPSQSPFGGRARTFEERIREIRRGDTSVTETYRRAVEDNEDWDD
jgi:hypothetical protein